MENAFGKLSTIQSDRIGEPMFQPPAASDCYALGDRVRVLTDIWEDEIDGLIPAGYLARKGEILVVKKVIEGSNISFGIAHENRTDDAFFWVTAKEIERA